MLEVVGFFRVFRVFRGSKCLEIFGKVFIPIRVQGIGFRVQGKTIFSIL